MSEDKNIFVTSHNQMGGITAHTVNFGPQARAMNDRLGQQLLAALPADVSVTVTAVMGDGEAFGFANQVLTWIKANGFPNANGVDQAVYTQPVTGQSINQKSDTEYEIIIGNRQA